VADRRTSDDSVYRVSIREYVLADRTYYLVRSRLHVCYSVACAVCPPCRLSVCRLHGIEAKQCILEQKLLLTAYRKSYMRNRLVPNE